MMKMDGYGHALRNKCMSSLRKLIYIIAPLTFLLPGCANNAAGDLPVLTPVDSITEYTYKHISAENAKQIMDGDDPYILLDVRTEDEYTSHMSMTLAVSPIGRTRLLAK